MMATLTKTRLRKACIIGSGPNGLAAAIVLAQAGLEVEVFEAEPTLGGGARTLPLTLPGFQHDFGSAVHPLALGSPFFSSLPLQDYGLEWIHPPAALAHPLDGGKAVLLYRDLEQACNALGPDGPAWRRLMEPFASRWAEFSQDILQPLTRVPKHPFLLARFGVNAALPATTVARLHFRTQQARALFAGIAGHSFLPLDRPLSASFGLVLGIAAHAVGWPIPRGGAQAISNALAGYLGRLGGRIHAGTPIRSLRDLPATDLVLADISPRQLIALAGSPSRLSPGYRQNLVAYRYGPGAYKVDYALSRPIPWASPDCLQAGTVHVGGTLEEVVASEAAMAQGRTAERPFVLLAQPTLFDPTRAPAGQHIAWTYCHVPNGSREDMLPRIEAQIERFAPGFRDCVLARHISTPADLNVADANLIGGDIMGGAMGLKQLVFRPTSRFYRTSATNLYLCSASTPPGGGVHGMCGYNAAMTALRDHA